MKQGITAFHTKPRKAMKRTPFKAKTGFKPKVGPRKRPKGTETQAMRKKCDDLLTPIIKILYPRCLITGEPTEVAHHHVKKSISSSLRYYIPNLIPLTHKAHSALHQNETYWNEFVETIKGREWKEDIDRQRKVPVKADLQWYTENYNRLKAFYEEIKTSTR